MRYIKDLIYKNVERAILCTTLEEAEAIDKLIIEAGGRSLIKHARNGEYPGDFGFALHDVPNNCYCSGEYFKQKKYEIFSAQEFLNETYEIY